MRISPRRRILYTVTGRASIPHRVLRGAACWAGAILLLAAGFAVPCYFVTRATYSLVLDMYGPPSHDLSDAVPGIAAALIGGFLGLIAGAVGSALASFPALALIGRSGALDRFRRRRASHDLQATPTGTLADLGDKDTGGS